MCLLKNENKHLLRANLDMDKEDFFVLPRPVWDEIDTDLVSIGAGTSKEAFGPKPRGTDCYSTWKAAECKEFFCCRMVSLSFTEDCLNCSLMVSLICRHWLIPFAVLICQLRKWTMWCSQFGLYEAL